MKKVKKAAPRQRTLPPPRVVIVGFGRVGGALALGLQAAQWDVAVLPRSADSVRRAASLRFPCVSFKVRTIKSFSASIIVAGDLREGIPAVR